MEYENWNIGRPDSLGKEDNCALMIKHNCDTNHWFDVDCS